MTFKTVHGLGRSDYAKKAFETAMSNFANPSFVDAWLEWFDKQPGDGMAGRDESPCLTMAGQCERCPSPAVCPPECPENDPDMPQPEYYLGDLEEVAHAMVTRTESALSELVRQMARPGSVATLDPAVKALFDGIRSEISLPGYVEELLPE
ncbi:hypothetical protein ACSLOU_00640 [Enterobacter cloacae]|uniref:hypothetical protein n=1 Tax=Enterobacter cloacae TaxID=550 RepID=UPI003EE275C2